jgi:hypothetical protein
MTMSLFTRAPLAVACAVLSAFHRIPRGAAGPHPLRQRTLQRGLARHVGSELAGGAPKRLFLSIAIATGVLICSGDAFAQTTPYPLQQPTTNTPSTTARTKIAPAKTQTTKTEPRTSQSQFHQAKKEHGHGYSHGGGGGVGVGVGATIDLGGIGQRRPEADPFAVPAGPQPVTARTEEKPKTPKKTREPAKTDPFAGVQLTGEQAKEQKIPR